MKQIFVHGNEGSALLDSILALFISLLIISTISFSVFSLMKNNDRLIEKTMSLSKETYKAIKLKNTLDEKLESINIPYWCNNFTIIENGSSVLIPWKEGIENNYLELKLAE